MSAKVIEPERPGYNEKLIKSMMERLSFPSAFFDQPVRVRGVLFAAGPDSSQLARNFAGNCLGLSVLNISHEACTDKTWTEFSHLLSHQHTTASGIAIALQNLDRVPVAAQEKILVAVQAANNLLWFPSADDFRKVIPPLRLALFVYLGLSPFNKMQLLLQSSQTIEIDKGSLKHAPPPSVN